MKLFFGGIESRQRKQRGVAHGFDGYATKLADALLDVAEPFMQHFKPRTAAQAERVAMLAALAWNAELADQLEDEERALVEQTIRESTDEIRELVARARERKRAVHPADDRLVLGVEISGGPPAFRFRAAGTSLHPPPMPAGDDESGGER